MQSPLTPKTRAHIAILFAPEDAAQAERLLVERCGAQLLGSSHASAEELERLHFAALRSSRGRLPELLRAIELAQKDWRDLLVVTDFAEDPGAHLRWRPNMSKAEFYAGKVIERVRWYLHDPDLPETLRWARLRVFTDGAADSMFSEDGKLYGFDRESFASYLLTEDEYQSVDGYDEEDEREGRIRLADLVPPRWNDAPDTPFQYLGIY